MSEAELAKHFIDHFEGFDIYQEVPVHDGICDIVVKIDQLIVCIEVKMHFNVQVIYQAVRNFNQSNLSYVAVPRPSRSSGYRNMEAENLCKRLGVGVLYFDDQKKFMCHNIKFMHRIGCEVHPNSYVAEIVKPEFRRRVSKITLKDWMKRSIAGSQNDRLTDFKITVEEITAAVKKNGGKVLAKELFENNKYHYSSSSGALACVVSLCRSGVITSVQFDKGYLILTPL